MAHALRAAAPSSPLLLIGTDCPARTVGDLLTAIAALDSGCDAVLGPVEDGGYSLIGLSQFEARLFHDIAWSTDQVLAQTLVRLRRYHLRVHMLPELWDVNRPPMHLRRLQSTHPSLLDGIDHHACLPG